MILPEDAVPEGGEIPIGSTIKLPSGQTARVTSFEKGQGYTIDANHPVRPREPKLNFLIVPSLKFEGDCVSFLTRWCPRARSLLARA
jgi:hypothetical protein